MTLLSTAELRTLRRTWLRDLVDPHNEIGSGCTVKTEAAAGATSVALQGLGAGTIYAGTVLQFRPGGQNLSHEVAADATITSNLATVTLTSGLEFKCIVSTAVLPSRELLGMYASNILPAQQFWSDARIEDLALQAEQDFGWQIARANQPEIKRYQAIRLLANQHILRDSEYWALMCRVAPPDGAAERLRIKEQIREDEAGLRPASHGGFSVGQIK